MKDIKIERIEECLRQGLTLKEADESWYVNTPNAPEELKLITGLLLDSLQ